MRSILFPRTARRSCLAIGAVAGLSFFASIAPAQPPEPTMIAPELGVRRVASGLTTPTSMAFLGPNDLLVLEKNTGRVIRVTQGTVQGPVLDLGVNFASERGLLGIALHPGFPSTPQVFLYWTARSTAPPADPFFPDERVPLDANMFAPDTDDVLMVPLLGNRVDRFTWNGSTLLYDRNLIYLRAFQNDGGPVPAGQGDADQPPRGNHDGGVIAFGPDGFLYVYIGDQGRRGQLQNLPSGPTPTGLGPVMPDDQFGGPEPDDAHLTGVVLRLDTDGTPPPDNPFYAAGAAIGGEVGRNIQKIFAYGLRNSFGMAFDPMSGRLWETDNAEDAFDEINRIDPGMNGGWIQVQGPLARVDEYRAIETTSLHNEEVPNLQQLRWGPENIATRRQEARQRLFELPGAAYRDPQLSFKYVVPPAALGFAGSGLGPEFEGDMFWGMAVPTAEGGALFRVSLNRPRTRIRPEDRRLRDGVVDNATFNDLTEAETLLAGRNFGVLTDLETGPNGNLFAVSVDRGAIFEIFRNEGSGRVAERGPGRERTIASLASTSPIRPGGSAEIRFVLSARGRVELGVYDVHGRRVASLVEEDSGPGARTVAWNGKDESGRPVASGLYLVRLRVDGSEGPSELEARKVMVIR